MNEVIAHLDISTPAGRKIVRELEKHKKSVRVEYPVPEELARQKFYTEEEFWSGVEERFNKHYGTNYKFK